MNTINITDENALMHLNVKNWTKKDGNIKSNYKSIISIENWELKVVKLDAHMVTMADKDKSILLIKNTEL